MRVGGLIAAITLLAISCSGPSPTANTPSPNGSPSPTGAPAVKSYGLLISGGTLQMITPSGTVAASVKVAAPSRHLCGRGAVAPLQPPVSATNDKVFFRDGNTTIRFLTPDGQVANATTVPGSGSKISFFSVSPDNLRIAVLVEDFLPVDKINLTLYVEDLIGHKHHKVIYTNTVPKMVTGRTLWPMGWHRGQLVLGVFPSCTSAPANVVPTEWHVANATTAIRVAKIGNPCEPSYWPSPAGVVCIQRGKTLAYTIAWTGKITNRLRICCDDFQSSLSPSGDSYFITPRPGLGAAPATRVVSLAGGRGASLLARSACLWIDENHLLTPDAVIGLDQSVIRPPTPPPPSPSPSPRPTSTPVPSGTPLVTSTPVATPSPNSEVTPSVTVLPAAGLCAGRFPGGL